MSLIKLDSPAYRVYCCALCGEAIPSSDHPTVIVLAPSDEQLRRSHPLFPSPPPERLYYCSACEGDAERHAATRALARP